MFESPAFEHITNFRDFGGVETVSGAQVLRGRLYRAAHLGDATEGDLARMRTLRLQAIVDLRRLEERRSHPNRIPRREPPLVEQLTVIESDIGGDGEAPHVAFLRQGDLSDAAIERFMLDFYQEAPYEPRHRDLFGRTFALLPELSGGILVHCAAGKDRTGLLAALILSALGVPESSIMADYLRTNEGAFTPPRVALIAEQVQARLGIAPSDALVRILLGVKAAYLERALATIRDRSGSIDLYLDGLGVGPGLRERLCLQLTTSG